MELKKLDYNLTVCKLNSAAEIDLSKDFCFIAKTDEEISLVCKTEDTPSQTLKREDGWKAFRIQGTRLFPDRHPVKNFRLPGRKQNRHLRRFNLERGKTSGRPSAYYPMPDTLSTDPISCSPK